MTYTSTHHLQMKVLSVLVDKLTGWVRFVALLLTLLFITLVLSFNDSQATLVQPENIDRTVPFNPSIFTQGIIVEGDNIYVSSGLYEKSFYGKLSTKNGKLTTLSNLPDDRFAEGIAYAGKPDEIWQLTWKKGVAYKRNKHTGKVINTTTYEGQGWGLTYDQKRHVLYQTDGTSTIYIRKPETFERIDEFEITDSSSQLNDLTVLDDTLYINTFSQNNQIISVKLTDIKDNQVEIHQIYDLTPVLPLLRGDSKTTDPANDVINGLDTVDDLIFVTGKRFENAALIDFERNVTHD